MPGKLYVVATPIGNLGDLTPRAAETLEKVDFIAAEDTRVTLKLLNHLGIKKPLVSYHEHNEYQRAGAVLERVEAGESCALCSDAGIPAISDPGQILVAEAGERGIEIIPIPGANAALSALCISGQNTSRFVFEGFLSQNRTQRRQRLDALLGEERTILLYEAPHKLLRTLDDLIGTFGRGRSVTLCRELTKVHEETIKTTLAGAKELYAERTPRGEFVLVLAGCDASAKMEEEPAVTLEEAAVQALVLAGKENLTAGEAARRVSKSTGHPKNTIYKAMLKLEGDTEIPG